jgi:hypothetical protein
MSEIELQIQSNSTHRKYADGHQPSENPANDNVVDTVNEPRPSSALANSTMTRKQIKTASLQLLAMSWNMFLLGWNDGSLGPLLPRIQEVYHVQSFAARWR